ncbi:MAG: type II toxin-antitoxin system VapC family toxin [Halobacteriota archaeon]
MRFLDANIFIYAYYKPGRKISERAKWMKEKSKEILRAVNDGEKVMTTVVHLSEVNNFLKKSMDTTSLENLFLGLYMLDNVEITGVSNEDYFSAITMMSKTGLDTNDSLAIKVMREAGIKEIYSFDKGLEHFMKKLP